MSNAAVLGPIGPLADHAEQYGELGLPVFPVNPADKTPLVSQYQATVDAATIHSWWRQWPTALIGHRVDPGQVLLDVDPRHNGAATWKALRAEVGEDWPATRAHASGRGDGGGHSWWIRPEGRLSIRRLTDWAQERGLGHPVVLKDGTPTNRWSSGIDLLHHDHRYTILPPSPHPETGDPYRWVEGRGPHHQVAELPDLLVELLTAPPVTAPTPPTPRLDQVGDSIADWYSSTHRFRDLLGRHGWELVRGDGDEDGSQWRHPHATSPVSATTKHGCLFVYTPNTPFEPTEQGDVHGYTPFAAYTLLDHHGDGSAAARAAREERDGAWSPQRERIALGGAQVAVQEREEDGEIDYFDPDLDEFLGVEDDDYDWLVEGLLERGDRTIVTGPEGGGKSTLLRQLAIQMASGIHPFTLEPIDPLQVLLVDCENSARQARRALRGLRDTAGDSYLNGKLRLRVLGHSIELAKADVMADIGARIEAQEVDVLIIGPLYKLLDDDPVKEMPAKAVADAIDWLRARRQSAILIEAHSPYSDGGGRSRPVRPYGASLWSRWPEFGMHLGADGVITHWRGQRVERAWPKALERSTPWPWAPKYEATAEPKPWDGPTECYEAVLAFFREGGGEHSVNQIHSRLRERGHAFRKPTISQAARIAHERGLLDCRTGPRSALIYSPAMERIGGIVLDRHHDEEEF